MTVIVMFFEKRTPSTPDNEPGRIYSLAVDSAADSYFEIEDKLERLKSHGYEIVSVVVDGIEELVSSSSVPDYITLQSYLEAQLDEYPEDDAPTVRVLVDGFSSFNEDWRDGYHGCYDYPEDYAKSFVKDRNIHIPSWMHVDWTATADQLEHDGDIIKEYRGLYYVFTR